MSGLSQDVRYALRTLGKNRGFALVAVLTLALGMGANTAIFSVVDSVLLQKLPFRNSSQLVAVRESTAHDEGLAISVPNFADYRAQQHTFQDLSLWIAQSVNLTGTEQPDRLIGSFSSSNLFSLLGVEALNGRTFLPGEDAPGAAPVALVSYGTWKNRFAGDPDLVGKQLTLNGVAYSVIGILPPSFHFPFGDFDVWMTIQHYPNYRPASRSAKDQLLLGRIKDGVTLQAAMSDLDLVAQRLAAAYPADNAGIRISLKRLKDLQTQSIRPALLILLGAVALILLIACANVANLLLARGTSRQRELAVRSALGANRRRLVRQLIAESLVLSVAGGCVGILMAFVALQALPKLNPNALPVRVSAHLDLRVLGFAAAISLLSGLLFGVLPALQLSKSGLTQFLSAGDRSVGGIRHAWLRGAFVAAQLGISVVVLIGAGLLVRSFQSLLHSNPGFAAGNLLTMEYRLPLNKYPTTESQWNFHKQMLERVQQVPGVTSAAIVQALPFSGNRGEVQFLLPEMASPVKGQEPQAFSNLVTPEFFSTMGIPLLRGRDFTEEDKVNSPAVVVISQAMAQKYWPNQDPIGKEIRFPNPDLAAGMGGGPHQATVIGVVGDIKQIETRDAFQPYIYFPYAQVTGIFGSLAVRTALEPMSLSRAVKEAVWSVDKDQPVWKIRTMHSMMANDVAADQLVMALMSGFSVLALVLTAFGIYGVVSYSVGQRIREIGVRIALGATPSRVMRLVLAQSLGFALAGVALGLAGALAATRLLKQLLFGVGTTDPLTFSAVLGVMAAVTLLSVFFPARKATKVDPMVALRYE
jgi:putative ABC transport system permease protein